jgi:toxin ParE1/3/4
MKPLRYSRRALKDLEAIRRYIAKDNPAAADRVNQHLKVRIGQLSRDPLRSVAASSPQFRILFPTKYPYRVYFEVATDHVAILHIRHTSRQQPKLQGFHDE